MKKLYCCRSTFEHCLSSYSSYEAMLYREMNHGISQYYESTYDKGKKLCLIWHVLNNSKNN